MDTIAAMNERDIDISTEFAKPWAYEIVRAADGVVSVGCGDACPVFPGKRYLDWTPDDPAGRPVRAALRGVPACQHAQLSRRQRLTSQRDRPSDRP
ncbi:low molecular weight phosphatase family protein [Streptomyces mirabilis]|uniref:hypothetical protein n=1 Tax=Streptomyces mirabilis TaxID=68239 RepID=UPI00365D0D39